MKTKSYIYKEVRSDFYDDVRGVYCIDAWRTNNINEEGKVVAEVDGDTGKVTYLDDDARYDIQVQEQIEVILEDVRLNKEWELKNC